jgi:hypothetical protein
VGPELRDWCPLNRTNLGRGRHAQRVHVWGSQKLEEQRSFLPSEGHGAAVTLISEFWLPSHEAANVCYSKPVVLGHCMAALKN